MLIYTYTPLTPTLFVGNLQQITNVLETPLSFALVKVNIQHDFDSYHVSVTIDTCHRK